MGHFILLGAFGELIPCWSPTVLTVVYGLYAWAPACPSPCSSPPALLWLVCSRLILSQGPSLSLCVECSSPRYSHSLLPHYFKSPVKRSLLREPSLSYLKPESPSFTLPCIFLWPLMLPVVLYLLVSSHHQTTDFLRSGTCLCQVCPNHYHAPKSAVGVEYCAPIKHT